MRGTPSYADRGRLVKGDRGDGEIQIPATVIHMDASDGPVIHSAGAVTGDLSTSFAERTADFMKSVMESKPICDDGYAGRKDAPRKGKEKKTGACGHY